MEEAGQSTDGCLCKGWCNEAKHDTGAAVSCSPEVGQDSFAVVLAPTFRRAMLVGPLG